MKKILYSTYTKIIIYVLCLFCFLQAFTTGLSGIIEYDNYKSEIYYFEEDFENSYFLSNVINGVAYELYIKTAKYVFDNSFDIEGYFENNIDSNHMDYKLVIDDKVIGNMTDQQKTHKYYYKLVVQDKKVIEKEIYPQQEYYAIVPSKFGNSKIEIYVGLKDNYISVCENLWNEQKQFVIQTINEVVCWLIAAIVSIVYLLFVSGKDSKGVKHRYFIDRIFIEPTLITTFLLELLGIELFVWCIYRYTRGHMDVDLFIMITQLIFIGCLNILLVSLFSIVRNIKNKTFFSSCGIVIIFSKVFKLIKQAFKKLRNTLNELLKLSYNHMTILAIVVLFIYTAIIRFLGICTYDSMFYLVLGVILFVVLAVIVLFYLSDLDQIKKGVKGMQKGETQVHIGNIFFNDLNQLKVGIVNISLGLQDSINTALKAERMKTELITNVSHDLKTPLTSIINYTKLLSQIENLPEEAKDYIAIIDKKSERLKTLTQDLFDISKVQSGNEQINLEKLNVETLITQSLAEYETELEKFTIITNIEEDLYIKSDGRKMSRVFSNLLLNIAKYSLSNTRVFIHAYKKDNSVMIEMKNISSYPLDFNPDEIMQRFKRGDESRSEEGHGLGLAIVKSYVEATGGIFDITIDGDMFKAIIKYNNT